MQLWRSIKTGWLLWALMTMTQAEPLVALTDAQKKYLENRDAITMCVDPDWMPYEQIDSAGRHVGIGADYMSLFSTMLDQPLTLVPTRSWAESEAFAKNRQCDVLSMLNYSESRADYLNFTTPYMEASVVFVANDDVPFIDGMKGLVGKNLGIVQGYVYEDIIRSRYPDVDIVYVDSMDEAFEKVSQGEIFATIGSLFIVTSRIAELGLNNVKIAGSAEFKNEFRVGVRNDDPELLALFQLAVDNLSPIQENEILRRWISVRIETGTDYQLLFRVLLLAAIIIALLLYRHWSVKQLVAQLHHANQQLRIKSEALNRLSRTDALTKLHNRLYLEEHLRNEMLRFERYRSSFCIVLLDIDKFKQVNDLYGHATGDQVLQEVGLKLKSSVRVNDFVGRWGGEEFLIICPQTHLTGAQTVAETLRKKIENKTFTGTKKITCSFGVAEVSAEEALDRLMARVDEALYRAKTLGRNRVCLAEDA